MEKETSYDRISYLTVIGYEPQRYKIQAVPKSHGSRSLTCSICKGEHSVPEK